MTKMQRIVDLLAEAGELARQIEAEEGRSVHVLLLSENRNDTVRGILAPTVTAYQRPQS